MAYQIVYSSRTTHPLSAKDLEKILEDARTGNKKRHITGVLLLTEDVFLQILEGEKSVVQALMQSIKADTRHSQVTVFYEADVDSPAFSSFSMAYLAPSTEELKAWLGFEGTETVDEILDHIHHDPQNVPQFLINILEILAS